MLFVLSLPASAKVTYSSWSFDFWMESRKFNTYFDYIMNIGNIITNKNAICYSLGGSGPVIWSYFAEFQPKSRRGSMLSFMAAFWTIGNLFVAGLAWIIIPSGESKSFEKESCFLITCQSLENLIVSWQMCLYIFRYWLWYTIFQI